MLDELDYQQEVLQIVLSGMHVSKHVAELRLSLFIRAAFAAPSRPACLKPFPPCFFDRKRRTQCYSELMTHIELLPEFKNFTENTSLPALAWELLHWIFTNPLNIEAITESAISAYTIDKIKEDTSLTNIPYPLNDECILFKIIHVKKVFQEGKKKSGSFFAFHGSPSENFHSINHNGIISALNTSSSYGFGTYLSTSVKVASTYANKSTISVTFGGMTSNDQRSNSTNVANSGSVSTLAKKFISGPEASTSANRIESSGSSLSTNVKNSDSVSTLVKKCISSTTTNTSAMKIESSVSSFNSLVKNFYSTSAMKIDSSGSSFNSLVKNFYSGIAADSPESSGQVNTTRNVGNISYLQIGPSLDIVNSTTSDDLMMRVNKMKRTQDTKKMTCIAIVEVVNDSSIKTVQIKSDLQYFVVNNDDLMQLRYLIVFKKDFRSV